MSKGVQLIHKLLIELKVIFSTEIHFGVYCHHYKPLPFDIMVIIRGKIGLIEFDGEQHFKYNNMFIKTKEDLINQQTKDMIKTTFAKKHNIPLLRIAYIDVKNIQKLLCEFLSCINLNKIPVYMFSNIELYKDHVKLCE